jgi:hypothetical protein
VGCRFELPAAGGPAPDGPGVATDGPPPDQTFDLPCLHDAAYMARADSTHRYLAVDTALDYDGAIDRCTADGAHLVVIDDAAEDTFVHALAPGERWIGYDDLTAEGTYTWVTGAAPVFVHFASGEPNNQGVEDCVYMRAEGDWNDTNCGELRGLVCECDAAFQPRPTPPCRLLASTGADTLDGRRYFVRVAASWTDAEADCESIGATLPALSDQAENDALATRFAEDAWIGYNDRTTEGAFVWSNGAPFGFEHWNGSSPSTGATGDAEDCAHLDFPDNDWNDTECATVKAYACECDPAPP